MNNPVRTAKVIVSLIVAMTVGATVLMALDNKAIGAGAFSLASYTRLSSIDKVESALRQWERVEVYQAKATSDKACHFAVSNATGQIAVTKMSNWQTQQSCDAQGSKTIRICVVTAAGGEPTAGQLQTTAALVEQLRRTCRIDNRQIYYPATWRI